MYSNENKPVRPKNYLALALITTLLCCIPLGIVSIVYSTKVNSAYEAGNYDAALKASKNAKTWGIVALVAGLIAYIIVFFIYGVALFAVLSES